MIIEEKVPNFTLSPMTAPPEIEQDPDLFFFSFAFLPHDIRWKKRIRSAIAVAVGVHLFLFGALDQILDLQSKSYQSRVEQSSTVDFIACYQASAESISSSGSGSIPSEKIDHYFGTSASLTSHLEEFFQLEGANLIKKRDQGFQNFATHLPSIPLTEVMNQSHSNKNALFSTQAPLPSFGPIFAEPNFTPVRVRVLGTLSTHAEAIIDQYPLNYSLEAQGFLQEEYVHYNCIIDTRTGKIVSYAPSKKDNNPLVQEYFGKIIQKLVFKLDEKTKMPSLPYLQGQIELGVAFDRPLEELLALLESTGS